MRSPYRELRDLAHLFCLVDASVHCPHCFNVGIVFVFVFFFNFHLSFILLFTNCSSDQYLLSCLLYSRDWTFLHVILQGKSKVFTFVEEQVIGKSHQIHFYWFHLPKSLPKTAHAVPVAMERAPRREWCRLRTKGDSRRFPSFPGATLCRSAWGDDWPVSEGRRRNQSPPPPCPHSGLSTSDTSFYTGFISRGLRFK